MDKLMEAVGEEMLVGTVLLIAVDVQQLQRPHILIDPAADDHQAGIPELGAPEVILVGVGRQPCAGTPCLEQGNALVDALGRCPSVADVG